MTLTCGECGEVFEKPVLATVTSNGFSRIYYACPRCFTKVEEQAPPKNERKTETFIVTQKSEKREEAGGEMSALFRFSKETPQKYAYT